MALFNFGKKPETPKVATGKDILETINMRNIELPQPKEQKGYDWVLYGQHNQFPIDLLEYRNSSSLHDSIIESKTNLIAGEGFLFDTTRELSNQFIVDNWKLVPFWRKLDKIFWLTCRDQQTFGYSCFEIIYSMDRTRIVDMNWIDASRIASGKRDEVGEVDYGGDRHQQRQCCEPRPWQGAEQDQGEGRGQLNAEAPAGGQVVAIVQKAHQRQRQGDQGQNDLWIHRRGDRAP